MSLSAHGTLLATICNTISDASPYALWFTDGSRQCVLDLSEHIRDAGGLTGIAYRDARIYVAVQAATARILVLDMAMGVTGTIAHPDFDDLHSLHIAGDALFIVSTRNGTLLRHDFPSGRTEVIARFDPRAWVSGVLCTPDDVWLCCHHLAHLDPAAEGGGVFSLGQGRTVLDRLLRPHSLIRCGDRHAVLDSGNAQVVYFDRAGTRQTCRLEGFLRGAVVTGDGAMLVAGGPHRTISRKNPAGIAARGLRDVAHERLRIFELEHGRLVRSHLPELPGFEIYDLLELPRDVALTPAEDRLIEVTQGTFARLYYVALTDALLRLSTARP